MIDKAGWPKPGVRKAAKNGKYMMYVPSANNLTESTLGRLWLKLDNQ